MVCKYCFAELEDGTTVCPLCGKELAESAEEQALAEEMAAEEVILDEEYEEEELPVEEEKKPMSKGVKKAFAIVGIVLLAIVLVGAILHFMGYGKQVVHTLKFWRANDLNYKLSYTVKNEKAEKQQNVVIATVGNQKLTNGELQAHYWLAVYDFVEYYGSYLSYMGVDVSKPLSEQYYDEENGVTYQQMFLKSALSSWYEYAVLVEMAEEAQFRNDEELQEYVEYIKEQMTTLAAQYNYTDMEKFIDEQFFPGSSYDVYLQYNKTGYLAASYYDHLCEGLLPTEDEIIAYYEKNEATFEEQGIGKSAGDYYDVRHILVEIKADTTNPDAGADYTDAEWETCLKEAQALLDQFLAGEATEEAFAQLAIEHSKDPGSAENGGLYSGLTSETGFIEDFKNWYLEEGRKPGDTGLVKNTQSSTQGYHIMYFSGSTPIWEVETKAAIVAEGVSELMTEAQTKWPMEVNYKAIVLGEMDLAG